MPEVDFDAPDLAVQVEKLSPAERDRLPFGIIQLDRDGIVQFYSATEMRASRYPGKVIGENFWEMARRANKDELHAAIERAIEEGGPIDLEFGWAGDHANPKRQFRLRVQSATGGGVWLCFERDAQDA